jgi:hypothetical protein
MLTLDRATISLKRFEVGDLVYLKRQKADSMDPRVGRISLRIAKVEPNGWRGAIADSRSCGELRKLP